MQSNNANNIPRSKKSIRNNRFLFFKVALPFLIATSACSPVYSTHYSFTPPKDSSGRACIFQCDNSKLQCQHIKDLEQDRCEDKAERDYDRCERRNERKYNDEDKEYCSRSYCGSPNYDSCESLYRTCYQTCGGKVSGTTVCTAFCDQEK